MYIKWVSVPNIEPVRCLILYLSSWSTLRKSDGSLSVLCNIWFVKVEHRHISEVRDKTRKNDEIHKETKEVPDLSMRSGMKEQSVHRETNEGFNMEQVTTVR